MDSLFFLNPKVDPMDLHVFEEFTNVKWYPAIVDGEVVHLNASTNGF